MDKEDFVYYQGFVAGWRICNQRGVQNPTNPEIATHQLRCDLIEHSKIKDEEILNALLKDD
jgi:hypothetical protein